MKKINKFLLLIIFFAFIFIPCNIKALDTGYDITSYDVNMNVNQDNSFDITETIDVNFNEARHGIIRKLPLSNNVKRSDGTYYSNRARVTDVSVDSQYETSSNGGYYSIKIGDSDRTITGAKEYVIKYKYTIYGNDKLSNKDELYYNIIGTQWDTTISNVTFTINMPKKFDSDSLGFSIGSYRESGYNTDLLKYTVNDKIIEGSYTGTLNSGEGINVRLELPDGYFVIPTKGGSYYLMFVIPIVLLIVSFLLWTLYGRDDVLVDPVTFYPPNGVNSLETGYLYKGKAENKDVTSLLIYLANKGYLSISETKSKGILSSKDTFEITKLKDYDGNNEFERTFFNGLFGSSSTVSMMDLYNKFYITTNSILRSINSKENKEKVFEKKSLISKAIIIALTVITYLIIVVPPILEYNPDELFLVTLFPIAGIIVVIVVILSNSDIFSKIFSLLMFGGGFIIMPLVIGLSDIVSYDGFYIASTIVGVLCMIIMIFFASIADKRTKYGSEMLGKLKGFKNFLETAEKEKLEALVSKNPSYFYDILPYTYVLGVSDKWIKKFEDINMEAPNWYSGYDTFNYMRFSDSFDHLMSTSASAMTSVPSSSSSGGGSGFSGGGFSGGGSGGGGGSSW